MSMKSTSTYQVIAWKNIPAIVEARDAADTVTRSLSDRFQMLIDSVAMQLELEDSEAYLAEWTRTEPEERAGSAAEVADAVTRELEERFPEFVARAFTRP